MVLSRASVFLFVCFQNPNLRSFSLPLSTGVKKPLSRHRFPCGIGVVLSRSSLCAERLKQCFLSSLVWRAYLRCSVFFCREMRRCVFFSDLLREVILLLENSLVWLTRLLLILNDVFVR